MTSHESETKNNKEKSIDLDELQQETEKLLSLLQNRQPGLLTWNQFLKERLQKMHALTSKVFCK